MQEAIDTRPEDQNTLFRHTRRPEWGLAMLAWERGDQRGYQFRDGRLRVLKDGFYHLMEPAEVGDAKETRVTTELEETLSVRGGERQEPLRPEYPFEDQLRIFRKLYPQGFAGERWRHDRRGDGDGTLKRHREPAVEAAHERLAAEDLDRLVDEGRPGAVVDRAVEVLAGTSLVSAARVRELDDLEGEDRARAGRALRELLHGEGSYGTRFDGWLESLEKGLARAPSWRLATALPALVHPDEHACVRASAFRRQAAVFAPDRLYSRQPMRTAYANYRQVAQATRDRLEEEGFAPRDLLDVHDFVWTTLRPSAADHLTAN